MEWKLRDYQKECIEKINEEGKEGHHLVVMATGLGKTAVFANIKREGRTLILSHRDELVRQPEKYYKDCSFGVEKAEEHADGEDVVSASVQTLSKDSRLSKYGPDAFHTIIIDEAHHAAAPSYRKIIDYFSEAKQVIGVTATPTRGDGVRLTDVFHNILFVRDLRWGIEHNWLSPIHAKRVIAKYRLGGVKKVAGDYSASSLNEAMGEDSFSVAAKAYVTSCHTCGRHTLIYCVSVEACMILLGVIRNLLPEEERDSVVVLTGSTPQEERTEMLKQFMSGQIKCIINCMVLTEGTDLPICDTVMNFRPTCNASLYQQMIGRGTRKYEGKDYCLIIDIIPSDERRLRGLCTAPTLFGVDPSILDERVKSHITEDVDLMQLCDEITQRVNAATSLGKMMEIRTEISEAFIRSRMSLVLGAEGEPKGYLAAAKRLRQAQEEWLTGEEKDAFGNLFVEVQPDDEKHYLIRPDWNDRIYISKQNLLGDVTIDFHVTADRLGMSGLHHYKRTMPFERAVELAKRYCLLTPEYQWHTWNQECRKTWAQLPATPKQQAKLKSLYREHDFPDEDLNAVSKLDAGVLIDLGNELKKKKRELSLCQVTDEQTKAAKEKKEKAFLERLIAEKQDEEAGAAEYPEFERRLACVYQNQYPAIMQAQENKKRQEQYWERILQMGYFPVYVKQLFPPARPATGRQLGFLCRMAEELRRVYIFTELPDAISMYDASVLIEMLLWMKKYVPKNNSRAVFFPKAALREDLDHQRGVVGTVNIRLWEKKPAENPDAEQQPDCEAVNYSATSNRASCFNHHRAFSP